MSPKILEGLDPIHTTAFVLCMHTRTCLHFYAFILSIFLLVYFITPVFFSNDNYIPVLALWPAVGAFIHLPTLEFRLARRTITDTVNLQITQAAFSFMLNGSEFSRRLKRKNLQYQIYNPKLMFAVPTNIVTAILLLVSILVSFPQRRGLLGRYLAEDLTFLLHGDIFARNSSTTRIVQEFPSFPEQRAITGLVCSSILWYVLSGYVGNTAGGYCVQCYWGLA